MDGALDLRVRRPDVPLDLSILPAIKDINDACAKCAERTGSRDKSLAADIGIDEPTWARIKQGQAGIKGDFLDRLMDACGNELPLLWLLWQRGYDPASLRKRESELERQRRAAEERAAAAESELETIKKFLRETRPV